jgi:hypothetical protein
MGLLYLYLFTALRSVQLYPPPMQNFGALLKNTSRRTLTMEAPRSIETPGNSRLMTRRHSPPPKKIIQFLSKTSRDFADLLFFWFRSSHPTLAKVMLITLAGGGWRSCEGYSCLSRNVNRMLVNLITNGHNSTGLVEHFHTIILLRTAVGLEGDTKLCSLNAGLTRCVHWNTDKHRQQ